MQDRQKIGARSLMGGGRERKRLSKERAAAEGGNCIIFSPKALDISSVMWYNGLDNRE